MRLVLILVALASAWLQRLVYSTPDDPSDRRRGGSTDTVSAHSSLLAQDNVLRRANRNGRRNLLLGGTLCRDGVVTTRCICTLNDLILAIQGASTNIRRVTRIRLCTGSDFQVNAPINITGKAFALSCPLQFQCFFTAVNNTNLFVGAPLTARFDKMTLESGRAEKGGALHLTGGKTRLVQVQLLGNQATVTGGAIYVEGPNTELSYRRAYFSENFSGTGGAISVANGASVRTFASTYLTNGAATFGGAVYNNGGYIRLADSICSENFAATAGNTVYTTTMTTTDNQTTTTDNQTIATGNSTGIAITSTPSNTDCGALVRTTFCGGKDGIVTAGAGISNCREKGLFRVDPRCRVLGTGP